MGLSYVLLMLTSQSLSSLSFLDSMSQLLFTISIVCFSYCQDRFPLAWHRLLEPQTQAQPLGWPLSHWCLGWFRCKLEGVKVDIQARELFSLAHKVIYKYGNHMIT